MSARAAITSQLHTTYLMPWANDEFGDWNVRAGKSYDSLQLYSKGLSVVMRPNGPEPANVNSVGR
jgi:hypothetical protein